MAEFGGTILEKSSGFITAGDDLQSPGKKDSVMRATRGYTCKGGYGTILEKSVASSPQAMTCKGSAQQTSFEMP